jgi:uncharacterized integral membrane protein (TIGR00697 family)
MPLFIRYLSLAHICVLTLSNVLVQYPFTVAGFHTTWGAFTYPFIFIITDLTTRMLGARQARRVIFKSLLPGLISSYGLACLFNTDNHAFFIFQIQPLRIALACSGAYIIGQLLDIFVFQRLNKNTWWLGPACASSISNIVDTFVFFFLAFYHSSNAFLNQHWVDIACVDLVFKTLISFIAFIPLYGYILQQIIPYRPPTGSPS